MPKELHDINGQQSGFSFNKDLSPYDMAPNFFDNVQNARFTDKTASTITGHSSVLGTPTVAPYWITNFLQGANSLWIYGGLTALYKITGVTHADVTRASGAYTTIGSTTNNWQGDVLGGVLVVNNGIDIPQSLTQAGSVFTDLPNWPSTLRCKTIVPFKNHLVALNLTDDGTAEPYTIRWSDAIPAGAATNGSNTWVTSSTASEAAETTLGGTKGHLLNALQLGNELIVYKEDSIYSLVYVGGTFIFNVREKFKDVGLFTRDAVVDLGDGRHVLMSTNDVIVHNGNSLASIIDDKMKTLLFSEIDTTNFSKTFLVHNKIENEVWLCYPKTNATNGFPDKALIWNYRDDTWTTRELPNANYIGRGLVNPALTNTWTAATTTWKTNTLAWAQQEYNPSIDSLLICGTNGTKIYLADSGTTFDGTSFTTTLERTGLHAGRTDAVKKISRIYPRIRGTGSVDISVGAELSPFEGVSYADPVTYTIGTDNKVDCKVRGRYIAVRFESDSDTTFSVSGFTLESEVVSTR